MTDLRYPNITGKTEAEQIVQLKSYLHQLVDQLNWGLNSIETSVAPLVEVKSQSIAASAEEMDSPRATFNSIKDLIIKSADIIDAYYEEIDNLLSLSGHYVAQSDFGTYKEETLNEIDATDKQLRQDLVSKQAILDENGNIKAERLVNGHIYSGIIEYAKDGEAIVGIEIGQTTTRNDDYGNSTKQFTKFARFTAEKLSFYDINSNEVAYISDYKLYITHVEIKGSLKEGGYVDTISPDGGIVTKWVGGV